MVWGFGKTTVAAGVALLMTVGAAQAISVEFTGVSATFAPDGLESTDLPTTWEKASKVGGVWTMGPTAADGLVRLIDDPTTSQIWWGDSREDYSADKTTPSLSDADKAKQSGYVFDTFVGSFDAGSAGEEFLFADVEHHNGVLWSDAAALKSVYVDVAFAGFIRDTIDGVEYSDAFNLVARFHLTHDETFNDSGTCPPEDTDGRPCGDVVLVEGEVLSSEAARLRDFDYSLSLRGLVGNDGNGNAVGTVNRFFTDESKVSLASFVGSVEVAPIPLPAGVWMLLAGIGGLAAASRRKSRA